jgi:hypothetical protein
VGWVDEAASWLKTGLAVGCLLSRSGCDLARSADCGRLVLQTPDDLERASACTSAELLSIVDTTFERVELPALRTVRLDLQVGLNDSLVSVSFPALEQVNGLSVFNQKVLTAFTLPAPTTRTSGR